VPSNNLTRKITRKRTKHSRNSSRPLINSNHQSIVLNILKLSSLHPKKLSGYDVITGHILKALPPIAIKYLTQLSNADLLLGHFPAQWKVAQIILLLKSGKPPHELTSYRPISLLPTVSKVFDKILLKRILPLIDNNCLIPARLQEEALHNRTNHRVVQRIHEALENKQ
jgi:hypothetical protein